MNKQQTSIAERNQIGKHYEDFGHLVRSPLNVDGIFVVGICAGKSTKSHLHSVLLDKISKILIFIHIPDTGIALVYVQQFCGQCLAQVRFLLEGLKRLKLYKF